MADDDGSTPDASGAGSPLTQRVERVATHVVADDPAPRAQEVASHYVRPLAAREIRGMAWVGEDLLVVDVRSGRLALVDPATDDTRVVGEHLARDLVGCRGLALGAGVLWFTTADGLHRAPWRVPEEPLEPQAAKPRLERVGRPRRVLDVPDASAVAAWDDRLYLVRRPDLDRARRGRRAGEGRDEGRRSGESRRAGSPDRRSYLEVRDAATLDVLARVDLPGIGAKGIAATEDALWITDDLEQTVYCRDRASLAQRFMVVTPLEGPTAPAARRPPGRPADMVHIAYYADEPYLKDNPWVTPSWEVRYRDRALVHELRFHHDPLARRAWSTGHRLRMHYYAELDPEPGTGVLHDVQWRMSLPLDTARQRLVSVAPVGVPFRLEREEGQPVAVFEIPRLRRDSRLILGWRAEVETFGIKHLLTAADLADAPALTEDMVERYLIDDEDLDLDSPQIGQATARAVGRETNPLQAARLIRNHVYDRLSYEMGHADTPIDVLARGTGSCGEHVGVMMALMRRAGLACRVAGRYKCPYEPWTRSPLYPDFNHVWVDLYLPGYGWVPVESNPDGDVVDTGPYPERFFLGLPWRHIEVGKGISFEKVTHDSGGRRRRIGPRRLSRNHIRFDVLGEIAPG